MTPLGSAACGNASASVFSLLVNRVLLPNLSSEARRRLRNLLKGPNFRVERDADEVRILSGIGSGGGLGLADERSQLRATGGIITSEPKMDLRGSL